VPVVRATAVAYSDSATAVAAFAGTGVFKTTAGCPAAAELACIVAKLAGNGVGVAISYGKGVGVPKITACAVDVADCATAVMTLAGNGVKVATISARVGSGGGVGGGGPASITSAGALPLDSDL